MITIFRFLMSYKKIVLIGLLITSAISYVVFINTSNKRLKSALNTSKVERVAEKNKLVVENSNNLNGFKYEQVSFELLNYNKDDKDSIDNYKEIDLDNGFVDPDFGVTFAFGEEE